MARYGFIHDKLDIKFLILYFMARVAAPIDFPTLTELTVCDDGIGYFEFAEAVSELVESGHLTLEDGLYSITEKGRENGAACESSLPYSVKRNCSAQLVKLNGILRRNAQVRAETEPRPEGGYSARMFLDDDGGNLFTLELFCGSQEQANRLAESFKALAFLTVVWIFLPRSLSIPDFTTIVCFNLSPPIFSTAFDSSRKRTSTPRLASLPIRTSRT